MCYAREGSSPSIRTIKKRAMLVFLFLGVNSARNGYKFRLPLMKKGDVSIMCTLIDAGWSSLVARRAHNPKVVGSNPAPATNIYKQPALCGSSIKFLC